VTDPVARIRGKGAARARSWRRLGLLAIALLAVLTVAAATFALVGPGPAAREGKESVFVVERGDGAGAVGARLAKSGLVRSKTAFGLAATVTGAAGRLKPGEYAIPSRASAVGIARILASGKGITRTITFPEGWTVRQMYRRIEANAILSGDLPPLPAEGSLFPDTYVIKRGDTRADLIARMKKAQQAMIEELWLKRAADLPVRTKAEAIILASIVEKETGVAAERPRVAAVFVNRLRQGMKLQSDPTIIYGVTKGDPLRRRILKSEIEQPHPWNTYVIPALPPTPIANPGRDSVAAVLNPPRTRELFFVADGTGGHVFAETYAEHNRNVLRWRELRRKREAAGEDLAGAKGEETPASDGTAP
jgi:UPF0755 protein